MPRRALGHNTHQEIVAWGTSLISHHDYSLTHYPRTEHSRLTRLKPPIGFTGCDWSEEIEPDTPAPDVSFKSDEVTLEEESRPRVPIPIPVSVNDGKTLDWSRLVKNEHFAPASMNSGPMVHRE